MPQGLIIPCYNEAKRLPVSEIEKLLQENQSLRLLLVDDGSTDGTGELLETLAQNYPRAEALLLPKNQGKAEAVRLGLNHLLEAKSCSWVAYADADFATPAAEIIRLLYLAEESEAEALFGSRVRILGTQIQRRALRHYLGRVFATFASLALRLPVYDTQCGAKVFRDSPILRKALARPFISKWAFDVELIGRLAVQLPRPEEQLIEVPLKVWRDVAGSALSLSGMAKAALDVWRIGWRLRNGRL